MNILLSSNLPDRTLRRPAAPSSYPPPTLRRPSTPRAERISGRAALHKSLRPRPLRTKPTLSPFLHSDETSKYFLRPGWEYFYMAFIWQVIPCIHVRTTGWKEERLSVYSLSLLDNSSDHEIPKQNENIRIIALTHVYVTYVTYNTCLFVHTPL